VRIGSNATIGEQVQLTATVTGTAAHSFDGSATDVVVARPTSTSTSPAAGATLPPVSLPPLSGSGTSGTDPTGLFPTVAPTTGTNPPGLPPVKPHKPVRAVDAAATVPLDSRLIGGQLAGLAVLAGAVVIAVARLSLRTPKPPEGTGDRRPEQ
jgi:hypothetical protein